MKQLKNIKLRLVLAIFAQSIGYFFLINAFYYLAQHQINEKTLGSQELLEGAALGLLYRFSCMLGSALLAISIKTSIRRTTSLLLSIPALATGALIPGLPILVQ